MDQSPKSPAAALKAVYPPVPLHRAEAWVFDLDNTLYASSTNLFSLIDRRINAFVADFLNLELDQARRIQKRYFREYGTTLRGMMERHAMEPRRFLDYVHDIELSAVAPAPELAAALARLDGRKFIFTNATDAHAERVMARLGVGGHFDSVFDIETAGYVPKPDPRPYRALADRFKLDPQTTVMVEDIARNLAPAADMGMTTVWLRSASSWGLEGAGGDHVHYVADDLAAWLGEVAGEGA